MEQRSRNYSQATSTGTHVPNPLTQSQLEGVVNQIRRIWTGHENFGPFNEQLLKQFKEGIEKGENGVAGAWEENNEARRSILKAFLIWNVLTPLIISSEDKIVYYFSRENLFCFNIMDGLKGFESPKIANKMLFMKKDDERTISENLAILLSKKEGKPTFEEYLEEMKLGVFFVVDQAELSCLESFIKNELPKATKNGKESVKYPIFVETLNFNGPGDEENLEVSGNLETILTDLETENLYFNLRDFFHSKKESFNIEAGDLLSSSGNDETN